MRSILFAGAAMLVAAGAAQAAPTMAVRGHGPVRIPAGNPALSVLYTNGTDASGIGIVSQLFELSFRPYDSRGADDFTVPAGTTWTINEVDAPGQYFNGAGLATSEDVFFWKGFATKPGKVISAQRKVRGTDDGIGNFSITLPTPVVLTSGHYWVSVRANLHFSAGGEWGWETTGTSQSGAAGQWRNAGGGFATSCSTNWGAVTACIPSGEGPDFLFTLKGSAQ